MSTVSFLGAGNSILNSDTLEQLKQAQYYSQITPIDNKISLNTSKQNALESYKPLLDNLRISMENLSNSENYLERNVSLSNKDIIVDVEDGTALQSFNIEVLSKTKKDIFATKNYSSDTEIINNTGIDQTITLSQNGIDYNINIPNNMTLKEFKESLNNSTDGNIKASFLKVNTNGEQVLMIESTKTGLSNKISFSGSTDILNNLNLNNVQEATNTTFKYNGTLIERESNNVNDLIEGVNIQILNENTTTKVDITNNDENIKKDLELFVENYNYVFEKIQELTKYDSTTKTSGIFNGQNGFKDILREITNLTNDTNNLVSESLSQNGISILKDGTMFLDQTKFNSSFDFEKMEKMFSGEDGIFTKMTEKLENYYKNDYSYLESLEDSIDYNLESLNKTKLRSEELLNAKYEIMAKQFTSYSSMINQYESTSSFLTQEIESSLNMKG